MNPVRAFGSDLYEIEGNKIKCYYLGIMRDRTKDIKVSAQTFTKEQISALSKSFCETQT